MLSIIKIILNLKLCLLIGRNVSFYSFSRHLAYVWASQWVRSRKFDVKNSAGNKPHYSLVITSFVLIRSSLSQEFTISELAAYTQYLVSLQVFNTIGFGPASRVVAMTDEGGELVESNILLFLKLFLRRRAVLVCTGIKISKRLAVVGKYSYLFSGCYCRWGLPLARRSWCWQEFPHWNYYKWFASRALCLPLQRTGLVTGWRRYLLHPTQMKTNGQ